MAKIESNNQQQHHSLDHQQVSVVVVVVGRSSNSVVDISLQMRTLCYLRIIHILVLLY